MRLKKYMLQTVVLVIGCILGFVTATAYSSLLQHFQREPAAVSVIESLERIAAPVNGVPSPGPVKADQPLSETVVTNDAKDLDSEYDRGGNYEFPGPDSPKGFNAFGSIRIETRDFDLPETSPHYAEFIAPRGHVFADNREYKFRSIAIGPTNLAFETETKNGISYKFTGKFTVAANYDSDMSKYPGDLTGLLVKIKNGKRVAKINASFVMFLDCDC